MSIRLFSNLVKPKLKKIKQNSFVVSILISNLMFDHSIVQQTAMIRLCVFVYWPSHHTAYLKGDAKRPQALCETKKLKPKYTKGPISCCK